MQNPQGYHPPPQGFGGPPAPQSPSMEPLALVSLILGIMSWIVAPVLLSIPGVILAKMAMNKIERGEAPVESKSYAQIGFWLSMSNIILWCIGMIAVCCLYIGAFGLVLGAEGARQY
ncbi:MAG: DUF4190 domain-containing protein [Myxococcota bacterium]